ncbi:MAG: PrsW family intramembrane metalloprotease [Kineosporiaceae bacterium]
MTNQPAPFPGSARPQVPGDRSGSTVLLVLGFVLVGLCGLVITPVVLLATGPVAFAVGAAFAVVPVAPLLAYFAWLDRYEPEPGGLLVFAFGWGAAVATLGSLVLNTASVLVLDAAGRDPEFVSVAVVAPVVEEALKGLGILAIVLVGRRSLDGVVDGLVYAGVVGVGFAFVENILYLGAALLDGGGAGLVGTFVVRGIVSPFAHPLFTAPIGVAVAVAVRRGGIRWAWVAVGYVVAVLLHGVWNGSAVSSPETFLVGFVLLQLPLFAAYVALALWARHREGRLIHLHLAPYVQVGWLSTGEFAMLGSLRTRRHALQAVRRGPDGARRGAALKRFQRCAVQLAFLRNRMLRGTAPRDARAREYDLLQAVSSLRAVVGRAPVA